MCWVLVLFGVVVVSMRTCSTKKGVCTRTHTHAHTRMHTHAHTHTVLHLMMVMMCVQAITLWGLKPSMCYHKVCSDENDGEEEEEDGDGVCAGHHSMGPETQHVLPQGVWW